MKSQLLFVYVCLAFFTPTVPIDHRGYGAHKSAAYVDPHKIVITDDNLPAVLEQLNLFIRDRQHDMIAHLYLRFYGTRFKPAADSAFDIADIKTLQAVTGCLEKMGKVEAASSLQSVVDTRRRSSSSPAFTRPTNPPGGARIDSLDNDNSMRPRQREPLPQYTEPLPELMQEGPRVYYQPEPGATFAPDDGSSYQAPISADRLPLLLPSDNAVQHNGITGRTAGLVGVAAIALALISWGWRS